jgi:ABC-type Fe3+-hydroxamate transport system substrate-binding protein
MQRPAILLAAALLAACSSAPRGTPHPYAQRIVTLMPVFAQDLCALGAQRAIVGVSVYTRSASCASHVPEVADFASVDTERIIALHPDAVVAIPAQRRLTSQLDRTGIVTIFEPDDSYGDIFSNIEAMGALTGRKGAARALVASLEERTRRLERSERFAYRPSVFVVLQAQPIWTVGSGSYISTLLTMAGARNAAASLKQPYAQFSAEALLRAQPDAIVTGSDTHLPLLYDREPWRSLRAVREHHVFVLPDPALLERPGPDYNEGLSWLIEHLRPLATQS